MDYRELLRKYMKHVLDEEGVTYVVNLRFKPPNPDFSDAELDELEAIERQIGA